MSIEQAEETELESRFSCIMQTGVQPETLEISNNLPATHNSRKSSRKSWNIYGKMKEKKLIIVEISGGRLLGFQYANRIN